MAIEHTNTGLTIFRASRLEALLGPLQSLLEQTRPDNLLAAQTVIAAHPGMKQWLTGALARQVGAGRIVANLEVKLPSSWLDELSTSLLGSRAVALPKYRRGHLRWTLHAMLGEPTKHGIDDPRVTAYLGAPGSKDERALRRFQLADRLARVLTQYLVYRGDWLHAWENGQHSFATANAKGADSALQVLESGCLAPLWKHAVEALGDHRGRLVEALNTQIGASGQALPPLHVVGLSHLPPAELSVLRAYASHAPVFLYLPDPCREYWGGLHKAHGGRPDAAGWQSFRDDEEKRLMDPEALDWREQGHPLLARWGRLGQHFFAALTEGEMREDIRHWQDEEPATPGSRLERLQESIRQLAPGLMQENPFAAASADDASLRIHACHTRQRELEVLRDALLDAIERDNVRAGGMVVMAPDIQAYLPLIPAVFGEPGSARERRLPYHLADVPVARSHPLFTVFETLLGLGASRITAPEVVDLLGVDEVRRALAIDEDDADTLVEWLCSSRVAWALDGQHKEALSLPGRPEHSFAWALDRMLAGYLMGDVPEQVNPPALTLPDGTELLPLTGIDGPSAAALGHLDRLLCELQRWRNLAEAEQTASAWAETLRLRVDALLQIDRKDADARAALSVVHRAIANLSAEPARNGQDPVLRLSVVRELLGDALAMASERQRFLMGGITFCGMVPQRAIPFDVVCVLGLDEGAFPRRSADGGVDLMARLRRIGDRDVPSDDRYLFLETVMSARKRLHLSYIGQGVRDDKHRNPAAPLAELMAELELRAGIAPDDEKPLRPWLVRHPLQPFDGRYFDGSDPALFSYSSAFAAMQGEGIGRLPRLREGRPPEPEPLPDPLPLAALEGFFKDPAKALLREHLQLSLEALDTDERLPEDEPMGRISRIHTVARLVFLQQVLPQRCADAEWKWDAQPPAWVRLGGVLPLGQDGEEAWRKEAVAVEALWRQAATCQRFDERGAEGGRAVRLDVSLRLSEQPSADTCVPDRITGIVRNVFPLRDTEDGVHLVFAFPDSKNEKKSLKKAEDLGFKDLVPAFLQWALLRLQRAEGESPAPVRLTMLAQSEPDQAASANAWDEQYCGADPAHRATMERDLRQRLRALTEIMRMGRNGLSWFYPASGWAAVNALQPEADAVQESAVAQAVRGKWVKDFGDSSGERDYAPGYAQLLEGDLIFGDPETDPDSRALQALLQDAQKLRALILLGGTTDNSGESA